MSAFVFVVCGAQEHIDTLHFSLARLLNYSNHDVIVLTDSSRNEVPIKHDLIVDVQAPIDYTNHQASIYLKTGIYKFLPKGKSYCYLDSDVVALNADINQIFKEYIAPITFAPDHCKVPKFSPYAVNCGCSDDWESDRKTWKEAIGNFDKNYTIKDPEALKKGELLQKEFDALKTKPFKKLLVAIRYFLSMGIFRLNEHFYFDKKKRVWKESKNNSIVMYEVDVESIIKQTGFTYNRFTQKWLNKNGDDIWQDECGHLVEQIQATFNIKVKNKNWQHWNGGVFLFNDSSHKLLESWHQKTLHIFKLPAWKTRDQGTLIATAWEHGLASHPTLHKKWNFIADYNKDGLDFNNEGDFTDDYWENSYHPAFIHVYHHWGDESWDLWNWILKKSNA